MMSMVRIEFDEKIALATTFSSIMPRKGAWGFWIKKVTGYSFALRKVACHLFGAEFIVVVDLLVIAFYYVIPAPKHRPRCWAPPGAYACP